MLSADDKASVSEMMAEVHCSALICTRPNEYHASIRCLSDRPSTRAAIIEKLYQRKYIVKQGKSLRATETGINLIHLIISPLLKSAELTGLWEKKLREIERGEYTAQQFLNELKEMTSGVVRDVKTNKSGMLCPVCRQGLIIRGNTRYGCSRWREGCTYAEAF